MKNSIKATVSVIILGLASSAAFAHPILPMSAHKTHAEEVQVTQVQTTPAATQAVEVAQVDVVPISMKGDLVTVTTDAGAVIDSSVTADAEAAPQVNESESYILRMLKK